MLQAGCLAMRSIIILNYMEKQKRNARAKDELSIRSQHVETWIEIVDTACTVCFEPM